MRTDYPVEKQQQAQITDLIAIASSIIHEKYSNTSYLPILKLKLLLIEILWLAKKEDTQESARPGHLMSIKVHEQRHG